MPLPDPNFHAKALEHCDPAQGIVPVVGGTKSHIPNMIEAEKRRVRVDASRGEPSRRVQALAKVCSLSAFVLDCIQGARSEAPLQASPEGPLRKTKAWIPIKQRDDNLIPVTDYTKNAGEDFGLCAEAFEWGNECSAGAGCRWRHHQLTEEEVESIKNPLPKYVKALVDHRLISGTDDRCMRAQGGSARYSLPSMGGKRHSMRDPSKYLPRRLSVSESLICESPRYGSFVEDRNTYGLVSLHHQDSQCETLISNSLCIRASQRA
jgi:hypothetical protein